MKTPIPNKNASLSKPEAEPNGLRVRCFSCGHPIDLSGVCFASVSPPSPPVATTVAPTAAPTARTALPSSSVDRDPSTWPTSKIMGHAADLLRLALAGRDHGRANHVTAICEALDDCARRLVALGSIVEEPPC